MGTFLFFLFAVAVYIALLVWCLAPLVRSKRGATGWLRIAFGLFLLSANLVPLLALPFLWMMLAFGHQASELAITVMLFPRTLPNYVMNVHDRASANATVIEVTYPIEIAGVRYAPTVRTACTRRRAILLDKLMEVHNREDVSTGSGGELVALASNATIALNASGLLCPVALIGKLQPGPYPDYRSRVGYSPIVYVVRGEADKVQLYELQYHAGPVMAEDIVLQPPEIVRIYQAPANEVISLDDLWPLQRSSENSASAPALIDAYKRLPAQENACVLFITASMDFAMTPTVRHWRKTDLRDIQASEAPAYCRGVLARRIPAPSMPRISPLGN